MAPFRNRRKQAKRILLRFSGKLDNVALVVDKAPYYESVPQSLFKGPTGIILRDAKQQFFAKCLPS